MNVVLAPIINDLNTIDILLRLAAGLFIGFAIGLTGVGGGVLVMPTLKLFSFPESLAIPTANAYAVLVKSHAVFEHWKLNTIRRRTALWFLVGGIPADIGITVLMRMIRSRGWMPKEQLDGILQYIIVTVMIVTGIIVVYNFFAHRKKSDDDYYEPTESFPTSRKIKGILCGVIIGLLIGATSIGGGVMVIPMLAIFFLLSPRHTVGTSVAISIFLALISAAFFFVGNKDVPYTKSLATAVIMFVGAFPGVKSGSKLAVRIPQKVLKIIVLLLILIAIIGMLINPGKSGH